MSVHIRRAGSEVLTRVEPLWLSLHQHHAEVASLGAVRAPQDSWAMRREDYERWLDADECFFVVAEQNDLLLAYAFVRLRENRSDTWKVEARVGEVETLCVLPECRDQGIGERLMAFVYAELKQLNIQQVSLSVIAANSPAIRFYQSQGFEPTLMSMTKKLD